MDYSTSTIENLKYMYIIPMKKKIDNLDGYTKDMYVYKFLLSTVHVRDRSNADNIVMYCFKCTCTGNLLQYSHAKD